MAMPIDPLAMIYQLPNIGLQIPGLTKPMTFNSL
jgi:hypothetical protein